TTTYTPSLHDALPIFYQLAQQMLAGKRPRIFTDGEQARDHVYVGDVVAATVAGADEAARSGVYNVGSGRATTFNAIIAALNEARSEEHTSELQSLAYL